MLIGIEASAALEPTRSGVGNYAAHLIGALRRLDTQGDPLSLALFSNRGASAEATPAGEPPLPVYDRDRLPLRMLWMQLGLPRSIRRLHPDICHYPNHLAPVLGPAQVPYVLTIHDMSVYSCPQYHPAKTVAVHRAIMPAVARKARAIITVSESARRDILNYLPVPEERVRAVHEGINPRFLAQRDDPMVQWVRTLYRLDFPYVLTVGTVEPRKNHGGLIRAFSALVRQERLPHHLVIVGPRGWKERAVLDEVQASAVADRIHFLGFVPEDELPALYHGAAAFAFLSWYEGFGLPVLEALASGVPTVISHDPALCEVAGNGTTLIADPGSAEDMAAALHRLLTDEQARARLTGLGRQRAAQFSWERCAAETLAVYREALASGVTRPGRVAWGIGSRA